MSNIIKNILVISINIYPHNSPRSFRTTELVKELARQGHKVTLYIVKDNPIYAKLEKEWGVRIKDLGKIRFKDISTNSQLMLVNQFQRGIRRLFLLLCDYPDIELMFKVKRVLKKEKDYDLLISIAVPYPLHWGVAWARTKRHRIAQKWVADCGDPYMFCKTDSFKKLFYWGYVEKWSFRKADFISVPNEDHFNQYYPEFIPKMRIIPQGFKFEDAKLFKGKLINKTPTFAFAGVFLKTKRDPSNLLHYLSTLTADFQFHVFTNTEAFVLPYKNILVDRLQLRGFIRRDELVYELSKMDFLVNIEFHSSVGSNSPSKLIDYAITGKPILSLNMENLNTKLIDDFIAGDYTRKMILNDIDQFKIENVANQFIKL